jgi:hypothetical protein
MQEAMEGSQIIEPGRPQQGKYEKKKRRTRESLYL